MSSLGEVQNQLLIAKDVGYISKEEFLNLAEESIVIRKLISGLIKSSVTKSRIPEY